jgi:hypothetical protein
MPGARTEPLHALAVRFGLLILQLGEAALLALSCEHCTELRASVRTNRATSSDRRRWRHW